MPGQYYDQETGLFYNYFRYYDPDKGRYITSDPIGLAGGLNTYGYVGGNPLFGVDPFGLRRQVNLGHGWTGGIDTFNVGGGASFEIHVYDPSGAEAGLYGPKGWFDKHGLIGKPSGVPDSVENQCKGQVIDLGRRMGRIPDKGRANIKGGRWKKFLRGLPLIGPAMDATRPSPEIACEINPAAEFCN